MAAPNSGLSRVTRQSISHVDMPPAARPLLIHRPHTYPHPSSHTSQTALSSSESSSSLPPPPVIDPSLLAAPQPPLINGGINLAMVAPSYSPRVASSAIGDQYDSAQDYFGCAATTATAGSSTQFKDEKGVMPQWGGFSSQQTTTMQEWQQQTDLPPSRPSQENGAPYDLGRKKDGKIARPPNAWILYRSDMLKQLTDGKPVEGLEAALEELDNPPPEDEKTTTKKSRKPKKAPAKGANELILQLGGGKGGRGLPQAEISRVISVLWKREDPERRRHYENLAAQAKEEHKKLYPGYKFQPMRKDEKAAVKLARQQQRDVCRRTKVGDKAATKNTRRRNSRHKRSPSVEYCSTQLERTDSYSSQSSEQGYHLPAVPLESLGPPPGYPLMVGQPYATPLMGHLMSTPFPSSSRSGSIALSLPGTSSSPEYHHDFVVDRGLHMTNSQADLPYDSLVPQSIDFSDAPPLMGYSTMTNGYGGSEFIPGRPLSYGQPTPNLSTATPYHFTPVKVPAQWLPHSQGTDQYTDDAITDLAAVWCDIEEPPLPSPSPAATVMPATVGGHNGQSWAEHARAQGASMARIPMGPPGSGPDAGPSAPYFINQYQNGSGGLAGTPQQAHLEVPRMPSSAHGSPLSQAIYFDSSKQSHQPGMKPEHTASPALQHVMIQRTQGGDTLGQGLMPSPVDQAFPANGVLRHAQGPVASPQPGHTYYDPNSPSNLVPRHLSNSIFPLSPTGIPQWAQDRSFSSSSQQAQIMPSMSLTPGQLLGDDWDDNGKPPASIGNSPVPLSTSVPTSGMMQPSQRRVVTGYEPPAL